MSIETPERLGPDYSIPGALSLYKQDTFRVLRAVPNTCIDMIFVDPPFNQTYQEWDKAINLTALWEQYKRIIKTKGAIVMYSKQPFTSLLVCSNLAWFRCEWIVNKIYATNFPNAKKQPMNIHDNLLVFASGQTIYNPQMTQGKPNHKQGKSKTNISEIRLIKDRVADDLSGLKYPQSIVVFPKHTSMLGLHPNQKLVEAAEYFIKTYSNENAIILDNYMGSATTAIACMNTNRKFIGVENNDKHFQTARDRVEEHRTKTNKDSGASSILD